MYLSPIMKRPKWSSYLNIFPIHVCFICKYNTFFKFPQCLYITVNRGTYQTLFESILINQSIALCLFNCQICIYAFRFSLECILCNLNNFLTIVFKQLYNLKKAIWLKIQPPIPNWVGKLESPSTWVYQYFILINI